MDLLCRPVTGMAGIRFHRGRSGIVAGDGAAVVGVAQANRQALSRQVVGWLRRA
jgi:hypothetical protein